MEYTELQTSGVRDGDYIHTPYMSGTYYKGGKVLLGKKKRKIKCNLWFLGNFGNRFIYGIINLLRNYWGFHIRRI